MSNSYLLSPLTLNEEISHEVREITLFAFARCKSLLSLLPSCIGTKSKGEFKRTFFLSSSVELAERSEVGTKMFRTLTNFVCKTCHVQKDYVKIKSSFKDDETGVLRIFG